jgi:hypothetical protein
MSRLVASNPIFGALEDNGKLRIFGTKPLAQGYINSLPDDQYKKCTVPWGDSVEYPAIEIADMDDEQLRKYMDDIVSAALEYVGARETKFGRLSVGDLFDTTYKACFSGKYRKSNAWSAVTVPGDHHVTFSAESEVIYLPNDSINIW